MNVNWQRGRARDARQWWSTAAIAVLAVVGLADNAFAQDTYTDPPGRVARVAEVAGQVWRYDPDAGEWLAATRNRPLTSGDRIATDAGARAELQVGSTSIRLDGATELELLRLDDDHVVIELHGGTAIAQIRDTAGAGELELTTNEGRFIAQRAGTYRVDRREARSDLTVYRGQGRYEGPNSGLQVNAGQRAEFWIDSGGVAQYTLMQPLNDAFAAWSGERDRRVVSSISERYVSPEMSGVAELDAYGRWEQNPDYGSVWIPTAVAVDWAPYSHGHWTWVRPWGWTWVDDAPWGFAPFHYGRWVYARNNWCWTPGTRVVRPVYAPALVAWIGGPRGNVSVTVGGGPAVGWFPLAPREVYVPSYRVSPGYARNVNITHVNNVTVISNVFGNPQGPRDFENRRAPRGVTVVPAGVLIDRRPVAPAAAQFRQTPGARDFVNQPGRVQAVLAPPVVVPAQPPARQRDGRDVRPPPGAAERPRFEAQQPGGFPPRGRGEVERGPRGAPPREAGRFDPSNDAPRPPVVTTPPAPTMQALPQREARPLDTVPPPLPLPGRAPTQPNDPRRASPDIVERDGRFESRPFVPGGRPPVSRDANNDRGLPGGAVQPPAPAPPAPQRPFAPPAVQAPPVITPEPARPAFNVSPARPAFNVAPAPMPQAPTMRALPVQRGEDRRDERRGDDRRPSQPRPEVQAPVEQRPAPVVVQRPERPAMPAAPAAPPPVEIQRAAPVAQPAAPNMRRPEAPRDEPKRGGEGRGEPRDQQR